MSDRPATDDIEQLRARLAEAEAVIDAIRRGEVDGLVVDEGAGTGVQPVDKTPDTYRQLVEAMGDGAMVLSRDGNVLYANRAMADLLGAPLRSVIGADITGWLIFDHRDRFARSLRGALKGSRRDVYTLQPDASAPIAVHISLAPTGIAGTESGQGEIIAVVVDMHASSHGASIVDEYRLSKAIMEQSTNALVVCDRTGHILVTSNAASDLGMADIAGRRFDDAVELSDSAGERLTFAGLAESGADKNAAFATIASGVQTIELQIRTGPVVGADDMLIGYIVSLIDVTSIRRAERDAQQARSAMVKQLEREGERRLALLSVLEDARDAERDLRESEAHFRLALEAVPISVWTMDADLRYEWIYERTHRDGLVGAGDADLFDATTAAQITKLKRRVLDTGQAINDEVEDVTGKERRWLQLFAEPRHDDSGAIDGVSGATVDVTATHQLERARQRLVDAIQQSANPIAICDPAFSIEFTNKAFHNLFRFDEAEHAAGLSLADLHDDRDAANFDIRQVSDLLDATGTYSEEAQFLARNGKAVPVLLSIARLTDADDNTTGYVASFSDLRPIRRSEKRLRETLTDTIVAISNTIEKRDPYTAGHQQRVAELATRIAEAMGLSSQRIEGIYLGSLIHDIGKIYVPAEILNRPGKLTSHEFGLIQSHPEIGYQIIKDVKFEWPIGDIIVQHHERLDGSGYPDGLSGDAICLEARIVAVADIVEAMTSHRPYRPSRGLTPALDQIRSESGKTLDADCVEACVDLFEHQNFEWSSSFGM